MKKEKVYISQSNGLTVGSLGLFLFGVYMLVKPIFPDAAIYEEYGDCWILREIFFLYCCFMALNSSPRKVEFLEDESVRITFILGNTITLKPGAFKIERGADLEGKWIGVLRFHGRLVVFSAKSYPEFEKYLVK